jgi:hypothetical protein
MKKLLFPAIFAAVALAQAPSSIQQSASRLDAALLQQTVAATATTLTLQPSSSQSVYIYQIDFSNCEDATGQAVAAPTYVTTTNLGGATTATSLAWVMASGGATAAGSCVQTFSVSYPTGLKSTIPGTAVTVITPTFLGHQTIRVTVTYAFAP